MASGVFLTNTPISKASGDTSSIVIHKFGAIDDVTTILTPITSAGVYQTPTTLTTLEILSDDVNDTLAGSGARTVEVIGLGIDFLEVSEIVSMNGTTAVTLSTQFYRVYRVKVATSGTYASSVASSQAGNITLRASGGGVTWASVDIDAGFGLGQSEIGVYSIPAGKTGFVNFKNYDVESSKNGSLYFFVREGIDVVSAPFTPMLTKQVHRNQAGHHETTPVTPFGPYIGPCDVGFMGKAESTTADIQVDFEIELIDS